MTFRKLKLAPGPAAQEEDHNTNFIRHHDLLRFKTGLPDVSWS
jgi:hypothetical protein